MVGFAISVHLSVGIIEKGKNIRCAISDIFNFLETLLGARSKEGRSKEG